MPVPEFLTDSVVASQLAVLAGVHWCAKLSVAERTSNLALTPPLLVQEDKDKAEAAKRKAAEERAAAALIPWYRRFFSRKTAVASLPLLAIVASQGFFVFVLPRITNELVYQLFWMCMCSVVISGLTSSMLFVFFSGPLSLALKRHSNNVRSISQHQDTATPDAKPFFFVKRNRNIVAFVLAWCIIGYTAYAERNYVLPLFAGVVVIAVFTSISFFTVSARWMTFVSAGVTAFMAVFIPLIIALVPKSKPDDAPSSKQFMPTMPQWLLSLMMVSGGGILAFPVMFLVAMTLRYDHFGPSSSPALGPDKAAPGEAVPIPFNVPITRPTPLYRTAMATMAICYLASDIVVYHLVDNGTIKFIDGPGRAALTPEKLRNERSDSIKIASAATVNLFVPLAVALVAWCRGDLKSWWNYYEEWVAKENSEAAEQADVDDAEKALLDSEDASVEEKKDLST